MMAKDGVKREVYAHLKGPQARAQMKQDQELADAFDARQEDRLASDLASSVSSKLATEEKRRVEKLLERDREDDYAEQIRREAQLQAENGDYSNLSDSVVPPTPEQMRSGEFKTFIPRQPRGTVRVMKTVRRMSVPVVERMNAKGRITDEGLKACKWYAQTYSEAGFDGNIPSVNMGKEVFGGAADRAPFTERQCEAQHKLRKAREGIDAGFLKFFEAIVVKKLPIHRAARFARLRKTRAQVRFSDFCDRVYEILVEMGEVD